MFEKPGATSQVAFIGSGPGIIPEDFWVAAVLCEARQLHAAGNEPYARQLLELFDIPADKPLAALSRVKLSSVHGNRPGHAGAPHNF